MNFSQILKELRLKKTLTHEALAKQIGWSRAVIGDWERGRSQPTAGAIIDLAKYFGVTADYLLGLTKEKEQTND